MSEKTEYEFLMTCLRPGDGTLGLTDVLHYISPENKRPKKVEYMGHRYRVEWVDEAARSKLARAGIFTNALCFWIGVARKEAGR